jgi:site-specific recombinase XerD
MEADVARQVVIPALHAWSNALSALGVQVPAWSTPNDLRSPLGPLLAAYLAFRRCHSNAKASFVRREIEHIRDWIAFLKSRGRSIRAARLLDVDAYVLRIRRRFALTTTGNIVGSVRRFFRFLHATGRLRHELASSIQCPARRRSTPPRTLPWSDVRRIMRAVDRQTGTGQRDYAILLLMNLYGMGAAEVRSLTLDQICWTSLTFTVVRPKTGVAIQLPLLPPAARALATYLRRSRPPDAPTRAVFVRRLMPHDPLSSCGINHVIRRHAAKAGVKAASLGGHVFRRTHASRLIDQGVPPALVSSILGHQDRDSTSVYAWVALQHLRKIALPVPS